MRKTPNIVLITSDQHRGDCFCFEKKRRIKTPHLDFMARKGTRFSTCMTPSPLCQPARASILTGLYPKTHGVRDNGIDLPSVVGESGFAGRLSAAGYRTGFIGKAHFSTLETFKPTGRPENSISTSYYADGWNGPYMGFEHVELMMHYDRWLAMDGHREEKIRLMSERLPPHVDAARTWYPALPVAWHQSTWIGNRAARFIETNRVEPFLLWVSFPDPHAPFNAPEPWSRMYDPQDVDLPRHRKLDLDRRPWWHRASLEGQPSIQNPEMRRVREKLSRLPVQSDRQLRYITAQYYAMISLIDHNVGRILIELYEQGLMDRTVVVFTSDHGELLGDHGLLLKVPMHYEGLLRVGCVFFGPDIPEQQIVDGPVSTLDLCATFYEIGMVERPDLLHSRSLWGMIHGSGEPREYTFSEWDLGLDRCGVDLDLATVRTRRYKLTMEKRSGTGELYDLEEDPDEMNNRMDNPGYESVKRDLIRLINSRPQDEKYPPLPVVGMA